MKMDKPFSRWFTTIFKKSDDYFDNKLKSLELDSGRAAILMYLYRGGEGSNQDEIAFKFNKDKSLVSRILKSLEKSGFILRKQDEEDKRYHRIYLTEKGKEMEKVIRNYEKKWYEQITEGIPADSLQNFIDVVEAMYENALRYDKEETQ